MDEKVLLTLLKNAVAETLKPMQTNLAEIDAQLAEAEARDDVAAAKQILADLDGFITILLEQVKTAGPEAANARLCSLAEDFAPPTGRPEPPEKS